MTVVIAEDADSLWTVGQSVPRAKAEKHMLTHYLGHHEKGFSEADWLNIFLSLLTEWDLDYKIESARGAEEKKEITVSIVQPEDRNLLGLGAACTIGSAALAAFYDFYH